MKYLGVQGYRHPRAEDGPRVWTILFRVGKKIPLFFRDVEPDTERADEDAADYILRVPPGEARAPELRGKPWTKDATRHQEIVDDYVSQLETLDAERFAAEERADRAEAELKQAEYERDDEIGHRGTYDAAVQNALGSLSQYINDCGDTPIDSRIRAAVTVLRAAQRSIYRLGGA